MNSTDFLSGAPKFITIRFNSVNKYVWQTLFPDYTVKDRIIKLKSTADRKKEISRMKAISEEAAIVVFLFLLNKFFTEGAKAARQAVDTFKELEIDGFYIGAKYFTERNDKVVQGDDISKKLLFSIKDEKAKELVENSNYVSEILDKYRSLI